MNAVQKEIAARLDSEREQSAPATKQGLTTNQWTAIIIGIFTVMAAVLNHFGLIQ